MSSHTAAPQPDTEYDQHAEDAQFYRRVLHDAINAGVDLVRIVQQRATAAALDTAGEPERGAPTFDLPYERITRAIRGNITLARKVAEPIRAPAAKAAESGNGRRTAARKRIIRMVEDEIGRSSKPGDRESLRAELAERLDAPDLDDDIAGRPVVEIIADICGDLGIQTSRNASLRRTPDDLAILAARAAAPAGNNMTNTTTYVMAGRSSQRFHVPLHVEGLRRVDPAIHGPLAQQPAVTSPPAPQTASGPASPNPEPTTVYRSSG